MAKDKTSFVLYTNYLEVFEELSDNDAGKLAKHLFRYVNDLSPTPQNARVKLAFITIKQQLKRDLEKYEKKINQFSDAGKASANARKLRNTQLYIIECFNKNEKFLKIGITDLSVSLRYSSSKGLNNSMPYEFKLVAQYLWDKSNIHYLELESLINNKFTNYKPRIHFRGHTECYNIHDYNNIINFILNNLNNKKCLTTFNDVKSRSTDSTVNVNVNVNDNVINKEFVLFWDEYHKITKKPKSDKAPTEKHWNKLTVKEKEKSFNNIKPYYQSLNDKKYCKKARTYLSDKNFNDEFKKVESEDDLYFIDPKGIKRLKTDFYGQTQIINEI